MDLSDIWLKSDSSSVTSHTETCDIFHFAAIIIVHSSLSLVGGCAYRLQDSIYEFHTQLDADR